MYACMYVCKRHCSFLIRQISIDSGSVSSNLYESDICACMYVCMCVCVHVCMYLCVYVCMYVCMRHCSFLIKQISIDSDSVSSNLYESDIHMYVCMFVCVYVCMYVCVYNTNCISNSLSLFKQISFIDSDSVSNQGLRFCLKPSMHS
jgi:hypothetical protein